MMKLVSLLWLVAIVTSSMGPQATLQIKDKAGAAQLKDKVFHLQATTFSSQPLSAKHTLIKVIVGDPISGCAALQQPDSTDIEKYPTYFLVQGREGDCTFAKKVHWAKKALARGIIIIDSAKGVNNLNPRLNNQNFHIYLLPEEEGDYLLSKVEGLNSFAAQLNIGGGKEEGKFPAQIWISSLNMKSYDMMSWWKSALTAIPTLQQRVDWRPRFAYANCTGGAACGSEFVSSCACSGDFCSPEVHGKTTNVLVREDIRQALIFKDHREQFLTYIVLFREKCLDSYIASNYAEDCAGRVLNQLNIDAAALNQRIDTFLQSCVGSGESMKLYQEMTLDKVKMSKIGHYPTIFLNHEQLMVKSEQQMKNAVCRKLGLDKAEGCAEVQTISTTFYTIISGVFWFVFIVLLVGVGVLVVVYFRNRLRKEMNKQLKMQVSTAVEHYFQLSESTVAK